MDRDGCDGCDATSLNFSLYAWVKKVLGDACPGRHGRHAAENPSGPLSGLDPCVPGSRASRAGSSARTLKLLKNAERPISAFYKGITL